MYPTAIAVVGGCAFISDAYPQTGKRDSCWTHRRSARTTPKKTGPFAGESTLSPEGGYGHRKLSHPRGSRREYPCHAWLQRKPVYSPELFRMRIAALTRMICPS